MAEVWYCREEDVSASIDAKLTTRIRRIIGESIAAATGSIDGLCHRTFRPVVETREIDRTTAGIIPTPRRLWLPHGWELAAPPTSVTAGGVTIAIADIDPWPGSGPRSGPPYRRLDIKPSSSATWWDGDSDLGIDIGGPWGYRNEEVAAGTITATISTTSATTANVSDSGAVGIGDVLRIDSERLIVTGKNMLDSGQNTGSTLAEDVTAQTVAVADGTAFVAGETILIGSERMLIDDIAGNSLIVERGADGTTIAAHSSGLDVYAPRTIVVSRGALGTTAATHTSGTTVYRHLPPPLVREVATEEAITTVLERVTGVSRTIGQFSSRLGRDASAEGYGKVSDRRREAVGQGLEAMRYDCYRAHGRKARHAAI